MAYYRDSFTFTFARMYSFYNRNIFFQAALLLVCTYRLMVGPGLFVFDDFLYGSSSKHQIQGDSNMYLAASVEN
jgi:hypothetical protein